MCVCVRACVRLCEGWTASHTQLRRRRRRQRRGVRSSHVCGNKKRLLSWASFANVLLMTPSVRWAMPNHFPACQSHQTGCCFAQSCANELCVLSNFIQQPQVRHTIHAPTSAPRESESSVRAADDAVRSCCDLANLRRVSATQAHVHTRSPDCHRGLVARLVVAIVTWLSPA